MRRYLLFLVFVLSFCFASAEAQARKLALLVGVDEYENVSSLKCCVNDMNALKTALMKIGFEEDDIQVLVTGGALKYLPTKKKIEQKISNILSNAQPSDMVFIALSGHGAQEGSKVYFCPPDVEIDDLEETCVSITKIMDDLAKCKAKFKWLVVDACRNDPTQGPKGIGGKGLQVIPTPPAGIALFQSCAEGEESWEDTDSGNGFFTKNFVAALSGSADSDHDGKLTLMEVCKWTTAKTREQVKSSHNKSQRPYFSGSVSDFELSENLNIPKAKALAAEARAAMKAENYALAIEKYNAALALYPQSSQLKDERDLAQRLLNHKPKFNPMHIAVPEDFLTIEEAYKNVKDGGIVTIQPGKYELSKTLIVNRPVTFRGSTGRPEDVVIDCPSADAFEITGGSPSFQNLTASSGAESCNGFYVTGGTPKLFRCIVTSRKGAGMVVNGEKADPQVDSCTIKNCGDAGVVVLDNGLGKFSDCEIYGNANWGIAVGESGNPTVTGCKIHDGKNAGVLVLESGLGKFSDCEIYGNSMSGIEVRESGNPTFIRCKIYDGKQSGVWVHDNGLGTFKDCDIYGNTFSGVQVKESGNPTVTGCKIHDGKQGGIFVYESGLGKFSDCEIYGNSMPGIAVGTSGNPTVNGCKIHDGKQGGVNVYENGLGKFSDCEIYGNAIAGIAVQTSGNPTFTGCKIHDGKAYGVFVCKSGLGKFSDCEIYGNANAGIMVGESGNPTFTGCKIYDGKMSGVVVFKNGLGKFSDCEIYGNAFAGIMVGESGNPTFTGCKIHDGKGCGVYVRDKGMGTFNNNTLERNYWNGKLDNWSIQPTAGKVTGSDNTPPIPTR